MDLAMAPNQSLAKDQAKTVVKRPLGELPFTRHQNLPHEARIVHEKNEAIVQNIMSKVPRLLRQSSKKNERFARQRDTVGDRRSPGQSRWKALRHSGKVYERTENSSIRGKEQEPEMKTKIEVRPPWQDEMQRIQYFLPPAFLLDPQPFLLVAVSGRVERLVGAVALTVRPLEKIQASWLYLRVENQDAVGAELLQRSLDEAWKRGAVTVHFGQTVDEKSPTAAMLEHAGFATSAVHVVYQVDSAALGRRLQRSYERLRARDLIPPDVELATLQPAVVPKARKFLLENLPSSASALALETAGYKAEHSIALLQNGAVKGVLLCRRVGNVAYVGLRVVAEELRGGLGWANLILLHASIASGLQTGLEVTRFEFDPEQHHDTKQFAELNEARLVARRLLLRINNPTKNN